jgi:hypothetical protein
MQRRLASSIYAITRMLNNRLTALEDAREPARSEHIAERRRLLHDDSNETPQDIAERGTRRNRT